jgi:NADH-quinone oxidoreductase subunit E
MFYAICYMNKTVEKILLEFDPEKINLLPALKEISAAFGYIEEKDAKKIADYFDIHLSKVYETASFYDKINTEKKAKLLIQVCSGANCAVNRSFAVVREIENYFKIKVGDENSPKIKLEEISCLGQCGEGPIMVVNNRVYNNVTQSSVHEILEKWL